MASETPGGCIKDRVFLGKGWRPAAAVLKSRIVPRRFKKCRAWEMGRFWGLGRCGWLSVWSPKAVSISLAFRIIHRRYIVAALPARRLIPTHSKVNLLTYGNGHWGNGPAQCLAGFSSRGPLRPYFCPLFPLNIAQSSAASVAVKRRQLQASNTGRF